MGLCAYCAGPCEPDAKGRLRKFCCSDCQHRGHLCKTSQGKTVMLRCQVCDTPKVVSLCKAKQRFCSKKCAGVARRGVASSTPLNMRYGAVDKNQTEIILAFKQLGCSVLNCSRIGNGFPDLVVGYRNECYTVEVKNPKYTYGRRGLNENQKKFADSWRGSPVLVVRTLDDVTRLVSLWNEYPRPTLEQYADFLK